MNENTLKVLELIEKYHKNENMLYESFNSTFHECRVILGYILNGDGEYHIPEDMRIDVVSELEGLFAQDESVCRAQVMAERYAYFAMSIHYFDDCSLPVLQDTIERLLKTVRNWFIHEACCDLVYWYEKLGLIVDPIVDVADELDKIEGLAAKAYWTDSEAESARLTKEVHDRVVRLAVRTVDYNNSILVENLAGTLGVLN